MAGHRKLQSRNKKRKYYWGRETKTLVNSSPGSGTKTKDNFAKKKCSKEILSHEGIKSVFCRPVACNILEHRA